jgi:predicted kinase
LGLHSTGTRKQKIVGKENDSGAKTRFDSLNIRLTILGKSVVIDDNNLEKEQRAVWMNIAENEDIDIIKAVIINTTANGVILERQPQFSLPSLDEGFTEVLNITSEEHIIALIDDVCNK